MSNLTRRELLQTAAAGAVALALPKTSEPKSFEFAYFSDTHVRSNANITENREMLRAIREFSNPAFAINGGDVTEYGWAAEYDQYQALKEEFEVKTYENMGNHDVRWSPQGEKIFRERLSAPYQFFTHEGVFFAILDSTVPLSHWGHFTQSQLAALELQLQQLPAQTPVIIATHHWVGRDQVMVFNEFDLLKIIRPFNVKLILTGHGHSDLLWDWDTYACTMNKGLYQGSWQRIEVDQENQEIHLSRYTIESKRLENIKTVPIAPSDRTEFLAMTQTQSHNPNPPYTSYRFNEQPWQPLPKFDFGIPDTPQGRNVIIFKNELGIQEFLVGDTNPDLPTLRQTTLAFQGASPGEVMGHIHVANSEILLSTLNGQILTIDEPTGKPNLRLKINGYIHATPAATSTQLFVGSSTGTIRAINRKSKTIDWSAQLPGPVYARPIIAQNTLVIANHGEFFGLNPQTGKIIWQTPMPESNTAFSQSEPCTDGTRVYVTCWDSHIYCLDAKSGEIVWRKACQPRTFAFSPAIGSPCLDEDSVYCVANGNGLFRFNKLTGEQIYEVAAPGDKFGHSSPVHLEGRIYAGGLGDNGSVWCVDAKTGDIIWESRTGSIIYDSSPAIGHGLLAIGSANGILQVLRISDGKILNQHRIGGLFLSTPLIHNQKIYAATFSGFLSTFDLKPLIKLSKTN